MGIPRGGGWVLALRGAAADPFVLLTAFLVVLLAASLMSAIPIYADAVAQSSLRERLRQAPPTESNLQLAVAAFGGDRDRRLDPRVRKVVRDAFSATPVRIVRSSESEPFTLDGRIVAFGSFEGLSRNARLVAGRWPTSRGDTVEIAVPPHVAHELHLRVGDVAGARSRLDPSKLVVTHVVGIFSVDRPSAYWWGTPLASGGAQGTLVMASRAFSSLGFGNAELRWRIEPDFHGLTVGQARILRRELALLPERLNAGQASGQQFSIETALPEILDAGARSLHLARAGVLVPSIQLGLLAGYGLLVTALLLADRRLVRIEGLRLRGASSTQLVALAFAEATLIALPAVALAPWVATGVLHALNEIGPLATIGMHLEPHVSSTAYALAVAAGAVCVAGLVMPALRTRRVTVAADRRPQLAGLAQRARLDLVVTALALLGYWQLRRYHGVLVSNQGGLGIDPLLVAAPALLLLAGALLSLRIVPFAAELVERFLPSTRGAVTPLGFWQLARRPRGYARSVLLLVLAVAIGVFAATYSRTWHRFQLDRALYEAGADVFVEPSQALGAPPPIALASAYRTLGVVEALPVASDSFDLERFGGESGNLLALDAGRAAAVVHPRRDFASRPLGEALRPLAEDRPALASLPLPGRPSRLALSVRVEQSSRRTTAPPGFETRRSLPSLYLYLRDGNGVIYDYRLGALRPTRPNRFVLGLSHTLPDRRSASPRYPLALVGLKLGLEVPYLVPTRVKLVVRSLEVAPRAGADWRRVPLDDKVRWRASASSFRLPYEHPRVEMVSVEDGALRATLSTGSVYTYAFGEARPSTEILLRPGRDVFPAAASALASKRFLDATHLKLGDVVPLALAGGTQPIEIVGSYRRFPTLDPALPSVLVDLPTYVAFSFSRHGFVVQPSSWLLATASGRQVAERLRAAPFRSLGVVSRDERERSLLEDPAALGVIGALTLGLVIAAAFSLVGFAASTAASSRSRMLEFAVLRSLGLRTNQLSSWIGLENALVVVLSLFSGTLLGLLVAWLVLPYVELGASGEAPAPPVRVVVPWPTVLTLQLAVLGALAAIAAAQVAYVRRVRLAPVLRGGEESVAR